MAVNLSIKNVPDELAQLLRERARSNHRSLQGELMAILEEELTVRRGTVDQAYQRVRKLGLKTASGTVAMVRESRDAR
ncbi:MAG TPA: Arc family DNA-binding protein [Candidatus Acetothermia bacterium]|nr:Arc family DNA-binding protein [Candidatus Acetothermia bacterium]